MFPQIARAMSSGFTSKQIIDYLLKKFPNHSGKIKDALAAGFTADQVIRYLGGGKKLLNEIPPTPSTDTGVNSEFAKMRQKDADKNKLENQVVTAAGAGALGAGLAAGPLMSALGRSAPQIFGRGAIPGAAQTVAPQLPPMGPGPNSPGVQVMGGPKGPSPMPNSPNSPLPPHPINPLKTSPTLSTSQPPINQAPNISQTPQTIQPQRDVNKSVDILRSTGQEATIKNLIEGGLKPSEIKDTLGVIIGKKKLKELDVAVGGIEQAIEDYASTLQPQKQASMESPSQQLGEGQPQIEGDRPLQEEILPIDEEKPKPIAKKETVSTPQGIGEVKEIRNGKALVEIDGKIHKVDEEELEKEPEDIIEEVQKLLKIPEIDRSSIVSLFTFDPEEKKMYIQFHNGETYKYLDVDPEKVMKIANKMGIPVTKGKNIFGAWSPEDKKSLGAALIKEIINDPKYKKAKKGGEPNPNYIQLETLYDYWQGLRKKPKRKGL